MYAEKYETAATPPSTAFSNASVALDEARMLAARVSEVVDRLCGSTPSEVSGGNKLSGGGSVLSSLRDEAERTVDVVRRAQAQLNRLDREIP